MEEAGTAMHLEDSSGKPQDAEALNTNQMPVQMSSQSLLSLPEVLSSDHIFTSREQVRRNYN